ncbi:MAG: NACHT domain-containing protein [Xenococcaceae cyanobacterium MO_188.B29]|nr:NACHT domain-containing protein [Xenococcaceae cyanobacterium MO_188.B29]
MHYPSEEFKNLWSKHLKLSQKRDRLRKQKDSKKDESLVKEAETLLESIRSAGKHIGIRSERQQLEIYAEYWGLYIYELTNHYPDTFLEKAEVEEEEKDQNFQDWGTAPDDDPLFIGREEELDQLKKLIIDDRCQVVAIIGMRGIGKTSLAVKLAKSLAAENEFDFIIWRSLLNIPPITNILADLISFLSEQQEIYLADNIDKQLQTLLFYLKEHRCLLILDNAEAILQPGSPSEQYLTKYEGYGKLIQQIGEVPHRSCLLLTSREKPQDIVLQEIKTKKVRSIRLDGLELAECREILARNTNIDKFSDSEEEWKKLIAFYNNNPLALEIVAKHIEEVFLGDISEFLKEGNYAIEDVHQLLNWHFKRLSDSEKEIMYWLAINRVPVSIAELKEDILSPSAREIPSTLQSLQRKLPLKRTEKGFTILPVLMELMTEKFIDNICQEINTSKTLMLNNYALIKLQSERVSKTQVNIFLKPILEQLQKSQIDIKSKLKSILSKLQKDSIKVGYAAGNILNLMKKKEIKFADGDFSNLEIRHFSFTDTIFHNSNFSNCTFINCLFYQHFGNILTVKFSPDGKYFATGHDDGKIRLWTTDNTKLVNIFENNDWVRCVDFSPDGQTLATAVDDGTIKLWNIEESSKPEVSSEPLDSLKIEENESHVWSVVFIDDKTLASGGGNKKIQLWRKKNEKYECLKCISEHKNWIISLAYHREFNLLAGGDYDGKIVLLNIKDNKELAKFEADKEWVWSVSFSPDGKKLVSGGKEGIVKLWDISKIIANETENSIYKTEKSIIDGSFLGSFFIPQANSKIEPWILSVAFSPDGKTIVSGSENKIIRLWDIESRECLQPQPLTEHEKRVWSVVFSPDGKTFISGSDDKTIKIWNSTSRQCIKTLKGYLNAIWTIAFSPKNNLLASGSQDNNVRIWNIDSDRTGAKPKVLSGHKDQVCSVCFAPDSNKKMLASAGYDGTIKFWNADNGECLLTREEAHGNWIRGITFSPDRQLLASCDDDGIVKIWDIDIDSKKIRELKTLKGPTIWVFSVAFNHDGNLLASCSGDGTVKIWDVKSEDEKPLKTLTGHKGKVSSVAFHPKKNLLASCNDDGTVKIWDVESEDEEPLRTLEGHEGKVSSVAFHPEGKLLASCGDDETAKIWNVKNGECIKTLEGHKGKVSSVAFNFDGNLLASCSDDETVKIWDVKSKSLTGSLQPRKPYHNMKISGVTGVQGIEKDSLKSLGAE